MKERVTPVRTARGMYMKKAEVCWVRGLMGKDVVMRFLRRILVRYFFVFCSLGVEEMKQMVREARNHPTYRYDVNDVWMYNCRMKEGIHDHGCVVFCLFVPFDLPLCPVALCGSA